MLKEELSQKVFEPFLAVPESIVKRLTGEVCDVVCLGPSRCVFEGEIGQRVPQDHAQEVGRGPHISETLHRTTGFRRLFKIARQYAQYPLPSVFGEYIVSFHKSRHTISAIQTRPYLDAYGGTPLGGALKIAKDMIEDKQRTPSRAYRPTVVLVADGRPGDSWEKPLKEFIDTGRSSKCDRMAMVIGHDRQEEMLKKFIRGTPHQLFYAENAAQIHEFFQLVTMSTTVRSKSTNPNDVPVDTNLKFDGPSVYKQGQAAGDFDSSKIVSSDDDDGYF